MPYIREEFRKIANTIPIDAGELNYKLTNVILDYLSRNGNKYNVMNEIVGVLEQVKDEFQRRIIHPYEDKKINENGDVYS